MASAPDGVLTDGVLTLGAEVYASGLLQVAPYDAEAWRDGEAVGWAQWRRLAMSGVRMANVEMVLNRLAPLEASA